MALSRLSTVSSQGPRIGIYCSRKYLESFLAPDRLCFLYCSASSSAAISSFPTERNLCLYTRMSWYIRSEDVIAYAARLPYTPRRIYQVSTWGLFILRTSSCMNHCWGCECQDVEEPCISDEAKFCLSAIPMMRSNNWRRVDHDWVCGEINTTLSPVQASQQKPEHGKIVNIPRTKSISDFLLSVLTSSSSTSSSTM